MMTTDHGGHALVSSFQSPSSAWMPTQSFVPMCP